MHVYSMATSRLLVGTQLPETSRAKDEPCSSLPPAPGVVSSTQWLEDSSTQPGPQQHPGRGVCGWAEDRTGRTPLVLGTRHCSSERIRSTGSWVTAVVSGWDGVLQGLPAGFSTGGGDRFRSGQQVHSGSRSGQDLQRVPQSTSSQEVKGQMAPA